MYHKFDSAILYQSCCNHWMQAIIHLDDVGFNIVLAAQAIRSGIDRLWDDEYDCYGEAIEDALQESGIQHEIEYCKYNPEDDTPLASWEKRIKTLESEQKIKYYMD